MLLDKLAEIQAQNPFIAGRRTNFVSQNNKRTRLYKVEIAQDLTVTTVGTVVYNGGSLLGAYDFIGVQQGSQDQVNFDARLLRHWTEFSAQGPVPCRRLTAAQAAAKATYPLFETVYINLADQFAASPSETYFKENNINNQLNAFIQLSTARLTAISDAVYTLTDPVVTITQVFDENIGNLPLFVPYFDMVEYQVNSAQSQARIDLRASDYIAAIVIQCDTNKGEQDDVIEQLAYRGDGVDIIGPAMVPWNSLVDGMASESGGAGAALLAADYDRTWYAYNHIKSGRLSALLPPNVIPNLRLEVKCAPSAAAGVTSTTIRVGRIMYRRDPKVCAPELPFPVTG